MDWRTTKIICESRMNYELREAESQESIEFELGLRSASAQPHSTDPVSVKTDAYLAQKQRKGITVHNEETQARNQWKKLIDEIVK